jgi:serine protease Do
MEHSCQNMTNRTMVMVIALWLVCPSGPAQAESLGEVFKRVSKSVVVVLTEEKVTAPDKQEGRRLNVQGLGSGVLISQDGKVLTAAHVVQAANRVAVEFMSGEVVDATVVASDPPADLALLQLEQVPTGAVTAELGDSDEAQVADQVFVVGAPYGFSHSLTVGYISARRRPNEGEHELSPAELFQTDAAVNEGNSGGPMFNLAGQVIGIVSYILTQSGGFEGIGFAVTSNTARRLLLEQPAFWSGFNGYTVSGELAALLNVPQDAGVLVLQVAEGSAAARLGLQAGTTPVQIGEARLMLGGDIILEVMGMPIRADASNYRRIRERLLAVKQGETVTVKVLRAGRIVELSSETPE